MAQMVRVWRNECLRVFHDRLINEDDKDLVCAQSHADAARPTGPGVGGGGRWNRSPMCCYVASGP